MPNCFMSFSICPIDAVLNVVLKLVARICFSATAMGRLRPFASVCFTTDWCVAEYATDSSIAARNSLTTVGLAEM